MNTAQNHKRIIGLTLTALLVLFAVNSVYAQESIPFVVSPARQSINADPGTSVYFQIKFLNQAETSVAGNINVSDFIVKGDSGSPVLVESDAVSSRFSASEWITLSTDKAIIGPNELYTVQGKVNIPKDVRAGGRYAAIYFEPTGTLPGTGKADVVKEGSMITSSRIVGLVYIRINGPVTEKAFLKRVILPKFIEYGPVKGSLEIANLGDYHITPKASLTLSNMFNKKVAEIDLEDRNIFPDASRIYNFELGNRIMIGRYTLSLISMYGEGGQVLTNTSTFWAFPITMAVVIILGIVIVVLLVTFVWKSIKKNQTKLEQKLESEINEIESLKNKYKDRPPQSSSNT